MTGLTETTMREIFDVNRERLEKVYKEQADREEEPNFMNALTLWKWDIPLVTLMPLIWQQNVTMDKIWKLAIQASAAVLPEYITFAHDVFGAKSRTKRNGQQWQSGEMQKQWLEGGPDRDLICEGLSMIAMDRDGMFGQMMSLYERNDDGVVTWVDEGEVTLAPVTQIKTDGYMTTAMKAAFEVESFSATIEKVFSISTEVFEFDDDELVYHSLMGWMRSLQHQGDVAKNFAVLLAAKNVKMAAIVEASMEDMGWMQNYSVGDLN